MLLEVPHAHQQLYHGLWQRQALHLREQLRRHKLTMDGNPTEAEVADHYRGLDEADQDKDWKPFNRMLQLLRKYDGTRIYSLESMEK